ncbi:hypothetical protein C7212DRAFT_322059 [Tuber magnatum]|uniref:Uncharacterized protein n=1 Tax=Tuber magnatum TaxID=42249 RepID=A0A317SP75_9PEZI|nr:hypothetical protein C7212DRAFT_322059 [Tuber magnatum]
MRAPLKSPFRRALYQIPLHANATESNMKCLRANFEAIPGCPENLFDHIYKLRNENPVLKKYGDVYFSPLHKHWVVGTFSRRGRICDPMPSHLSMYPIYCQGIAAMVFDDPKNPQELLEFPIIPQVDFTKDQITALRKIFPKLVGMYVHPWGHVSLFFKNRRAIVTTFESRFLPVRLGGLTYSFELLSRENRPPSPAMPHPQTGGWITTILANAWNGLKRFMNYYGGRKPKLENQN